MTQSRVERNIAPVVVVAMERYLPINYQLLPLFLRSRDTYRNDLPREIGRILVLSTLIRIIQNVPQWSLRYRRGAGKRRNNCGKSERGTHDAGKTTRHKRQVEVRANNAATTKKPL